MAVDERVPFSGLTAADPVTPFKLTDIIAKSDVAIETPQSQRATIDQLITFIQQNIITFIQQNAKQVYDYVSDPNTEGIVPVNQDVPNIAYPASGVGSIMVWNKTSKIWI